MQYEGYSEEKPPQKKQEIPKPERALFPYQFHFEDWLGDDIYHTMFPPHYKLKKFLVQLLIFIIMIIAMRISVSLV